MDETELKKLSFKPYQKTTLTRARQLTQADVTERGGILMTKEGPVNFKVGDYLAVGIEGEEWPISTATMAATKRRVSDFDTKGFADYSTTAPVWAAPVPHTFEVKIHGGKAVLKGKPGDYIVDSGTSFWIVDRAIFDKTYSKVAS